MLSLVLPTYNEAENIPVLIPKIMQVLTGLEYEIIIVDDNSPDKTWEVGLQLADTYEQVHVIRRIHKRGLSSAVIDGWLAAKGSVLAVMDADGQHDLELLPQLYKAAATETDVAIGSRYVAGGSVGDWDERRHLMSRAATWLALKLCKVRVTDPMSGFFMLRRSTFDEVLPKLNPKGFKILLDVLVHVSKTTTVKELPFTFGIREHGESKLSRQVQIEFLEYLYDVVFGKYLSLTFVKYCIVGGFGVLVHTGVYLLLSKIFTIDSVLSFNKFSVAVIGAIEVAVVFNFWFNNLWTFSLQKLQGKQLVTGFIKYNAACLLGAVANYAVAAYLFTFNAPELAAVLAGAAAGVVWNYTMSRLVTWKN